MRKKNIMKIKGEVKRLLPHAIALVFCIGLAVVFFMPFLRGLRSFIWDTRVFGFPYLNMVTRTLAGTGHLPLWNPYNFSGFAFAGDIESGMFYPVNWLFAAVSGAMGFGELPYYFIFHFALGAFFAYLLSFKLSKNVLASLLGAVAFAYSGYALGHISHLGQVTMYMWIPAVVLVFIYAMEKKRALTTLLAGLTLGVALLVGHPNTSLYLICLIGGLILTMTVWDRKDWKSKLSVGISAIVFGFMVASIMLLPVVDLTLKSNRLQLTYDQQSIGFSLAPEDTEGFIFPNHNHVLDADPLKTFNGSVDITQNYLYFGLIPLLCLFFVFLTKGWPKWFFGIFAFLSLMLAFGYYSPLNRLFFDYIPGFNKVRMAVQVMSIFFFAVSMMAAMGFAGILQFVKKVNGNKIWLSLLVGLALLGLTVFDVFGNAYNKDFYSAPEAPSRVYDTQQDIDFMAILRSDSGPFRIQDETNFVTPNKWMYYGIENIWGNGGVKLAAYFKLFNKTGNNRFVTATDALLDFLNVKFLISNRTLDKSHFKKIADNVYENLKVLPRAYLVKDFQVEPDINKQIGIIRNDGIDFGKNVLLAHKPVYTGIKSVYEGVDNIVITKKDDTDFALDVSNRENSILVISETYDEGWHLTVDGTDENVILANGVFRAVALNAGKHRVDFTYHPLPVILGALISFVAVAGLIFTWLYVYFNDVKKRKQGENGPKKRD